jgi:hypothetical protein
MDENEIISAVCSHLERTGFSIVQRLHTTEQGVDIIAKERVTGRELFVEAKGGTSSREGSNRYGKEYTQSQVFDRVAKGIFTTMQLRGAHPDGANFAVALAVPDSRWFRHYLVTVAGQLASLDIRILMVAGSGAVSELTQAEAGSRTA